MSQQMRSSPEVRVEMEEGIQVDGIVLLDLGCTCC